MGTQIRHLSAILLPLFFASSLVSCGNSGGGNDSSPNAVSRAPVEEIHRSSANTGSQNPLVGAWVSGGYRLVFKADNTYSRDFNHDDIPVVLGSAKVSGNVIIVNDDSGGRYSCVDSVTGQIVSGSYTYAISGNTLAFNLFHDSCSERAAFFNLVYSRQ
jgi:hypothetical protein